MSSLANLVPLIAFLVTTVVAIAAAVIDFRRFRVPNLLTFPLAVSGLVLHATVSGMAGLQYSVGGILAGLAALLVFYILGMMGAGDVKLLAAVGAWIGALNTVYVFCVAGLVTGVHSIVVLAWQRRLREVPAIFQVALIQSMTLGRHLVGSDSDSLGAALQRPDRRRCVIPFAVMIAIGVVIVGMTHWG